MEERPLSKGMIYRLDSIFKQNHIDRDPADVNYVEAMQIISAYSNGLDMKRYLAGEITQTNMYNAPFINSWG